MVYPRRDLRIEAVECHRKSANLRADDAVQFPVEIAGTWSGRADAAHLGVAQHCEVRENACSSALGNLHRNTDLWKPVVAAMDPAHKFDILYSLDWKRYPLRAIARLREQY